jgi:UDP-N-acetylglucosamine:LPS N-acetylglucosamine transferase
MRTKLRLVLMALHVSLLVLWERPDVVISTGAAPGYFAIRAGKLLGARTIWVDSMANAERLSLSGRRVKSHADLWLTQWPHLAAPEGPYFEGAVL